MNRADARGGRGIFTEEHLRPVAVIVVIAVQVIEIPGVVLIIVLVHNRVRVLFGKNIPGSVKLFPFADRTGGGDNRNIRVDRFHRFFKRFQVAEIDLAPVFIAEAEIFKSERRGVPVFHAFCAPFGICIAVGVFNQVEHVLDVAVPFRCAGAIRDCVKIRLPRIFGKFAHLIFCILLIITASRLTNKPDV